MGVSRLCCWHFFRSESCASSLVLFGVGQGTRPARWLSLIAMSQRNIVIAAVQIVDKNVPSYKDVATVDNGRHQTESQ